MGRWGRPGHGRRIGLHWSSPMRRFAVTVAALLVSAGCGASDVTGAGCVTDLGSNEELCGADAKRFCADLAKQRRAELRVERHDFLEQRRLQRGIARDADAAADAFEQAGVSGSQTQRRMARNARRDASEPFRPRPADPADLESARVCREAVGR